MKAVLSCTGDDLYQFNLPFAVYSWAKLGVECIIFMPFRAIGHPCAELTSDTMMASTWPLRCPPHKEATYAQCSRLYAAALEHISPNEILVTADADMCVFNWDFWSDLRHTSAIAIVGDDLVPTGQYPMCYISMSCGQWREVMQIGDRTYQQCLDDLLGNIEAEHFRGNYWGKDQETAYQHIRAFEHGIQANIHRAKPGTQFATRRADRDGWPDPIPLDIIDAHLPRPGYTEENFTKIVNLFETMYPEASTAWMYDYRKKYLQLIQP